MGIQRNAQIAERAAFILDGFHDLLAEITACAFAIYR